MAIPEKNRSAPADGAAARGRNLFFSLCFGLLLVFTAAGATADPLVDEIKTGGHVLMVRHAQAPGGGDPADFIIGDCATQRNLDDRGRTQARAMGRWLRGQGLESARVFSSQWCRCLETARLMDMGPVTELPPLNSFFQRPEDAGPNLAALQEFLSKQSVDGKLIVLVTHFVTISGITGKGVSSGEGVLLRLTGDGDYRVLRQLAFGRAR